MVAKGTASSTSRAKSSAKAALNAQSLEALGAARLAELLLQLSEGDPAARRALRLALAQHKGPGELARHVRTRLASIAHSGSLLDDDPRDALLRELDRHLSAIRGPIADHAPAQAVELLWEVLELSEGLIERCDASDGVLRDWFHGVCATLGAVASRAPGQPEALADQVYSAVVSNGYGQFDPLVRDLGPALGAEGLAHLRLRLETLRRRATSNDQAAVHRALIVQIAMLDIADVLGDAEAYLAEYRDHDPEALRAPAIAAEVAQRLTDAGRAEEALSLLQVADPMLKQRRAGAEEWCDARLAALEALGRHGEAQSQRWDYALLELSHRHLRDYLKRLPDFEDVVQEERALDLVAEHDDRQEALWFLLHWPEPHRAARLVLSATKPLNGDLYQLWAPLADLLERAHPLAASVCLRAMIDFTLKVGRSKRYVHAARHLETCHRLAPQINRWEERIDHLRYVTQLRRDHGRKHGFWSQVSSQLIALADSSSPESRSAAARAARSPQPRPAAPTDQQQPSLW